MYIKKNIFKRISCLVITAFTIICIIPINVKAETYWPEGPIINTPSAIVMEINSGCILYEKNSDEVNYPASITKIMTTMLALEVCGMEEVVTFSDDSINGNQGNSSHIARDYGEEMTMEQCLYAVMLESANECAYAVAEHVGQELGGDYQTFIDLMNERAAELGCTNTHFNNANGLPDENHWVSAHDMALIAAEAYKNEVFREIVGTRSYRIPPTNKHDEVTPLNNHHAMISNYKTTEYLYEYCTGGKTGYTTAAGSTLVTFAEKDGLALVCVVMRTNTKDQYTETTRLFDYCFQNFHAVSLAEMESSTIENQSIGIMNNNKSFVEMNDTAKVVIPTTVEISDLEKTLIDDEVPKGVLARLQYTYGDRVVGKVDIIPSGVSAEDSYFDYASNRVEDTEVNVVKVKPIYIGIAVGIVVGIGVIILGIKYFYDNYYVIVHDMQVKQERRRRFRPVNQRKRRWKKKDRMFK